MESIGYFAAVAIGVALGLIGGGGSILTLPVLVYLLGVPVVLATTYSLFIVGFTALLGSISYYKQKLVDLKIFIAFGVPSVISVFLTRLYIVPLLPDEIMQIGSLVVTKDLFIMTVFAILMMGAAYGMLRPSRSKGGGEEKEEVAESKKLNYPLVLLEGAVVGGVTGLVGAGGGFLIIPALVFLGKLPMKVAVGTSLLIIAAKSLIGFFAESHEVAVDWVLLSLVSAFAVLGMLVGTSIAKHIDGEKIKPMFGWFTLVMGVYILIKEIFY
jgi:uncharacterized membrane protein YfcA